MVMNKQEVELVGYLRFEKTLRESLYQSIKRGFDILVSSVLLIPCVPLFAIVAIWIALDSRGGVFYTQTRIGQNGKEFKI